MVEDTFGLQPPIDTVGAPPKIELSRDSVNELLLLARLGEVSAALIVECEYDLFEPVYGVVFDVVSNSLVKDMAERKRKKRR